MVSEERVASVDIRDLDTPIKSLYLQPMKGFFFGWIENVGDTARILGTSTQVGELGAVGGGCARKMRV